MVQSVHSWKRKGGASQVAGALPDQRCLNTRDAAAYLGVSVALMRSWRLRGPDDRNAGPPFIRLSATMVIYDVVDLDDFLARKRLATQAEYQQSAVAA